MSDWPRLTLEEAGIVLLDCDHETPTFVSDGFPYVTIPQMQDREIYLEDARRISRGDFDHWTRKTRPEVHDVILSRRCNPGDTAVVRERMQFALGQNLVLLRSKNAKVVPQYLRWMTQGPDWWVQVGKYLNHGAVFDSLKCKNIPAFLLPVPPREEQAKISELLSSLDDKMVLNRRMARTLEAIARALFQSWFVDFEPVRRAAAGEGTGLPPDFAALFPKRLMDDGLPEGWTTTPLSKTANFLNGLALQRFPATDDVPSLPVIKIAEMRSGLKTTSARATSALPSSDYIVEDGDHLFSWSGSLMHCLWSDGRGALNQHLFKVIPTSAPAWLCYFSVDHFMPEFQRIAAAKAVTMGHIQRHHLDEAILAFPPEELLKRIGDVIEPMFERLKSLARESRTLASLRDALLPKLISGELRIRDAAESA